MKKLAITVALLLFFSLSHAQQKKSLDNETYKNWPILTPCEMSNDGRYITYTVTTAVGGNKLFLQETSTKNKTEIFGGVNSLFTQDSRRLIFQKSSDSLGILNLSTMQIKFWEDIADFKIPKNGNGRWLAFLSKKRNGELILLDLFTDSERLFQSVKEYQFADNGNAMWFKDNSSLFWHDLTDNKTVKVSDEYSSKITFDQSGTAICFLSKTPGGLCINYYRPGIERARQVVTDSMLFHRYGRIINKFSSLSFNTTSNGIFFNISKVDSLGTETSTRASSAKIFTYRDGLLDYQHEGKTGGISGFRAVVNLDKLEDVIQLLRDNDYSSIRTCYRNKDYLIVYRKKIKPYPKHVLGETNGAKSRYFLNLVDLYLISTEDGSRKLIKNDVSVDNISASSTGKYVAWFDGHLKNWYLYNISNGTVLAITKRVTASLANKTSIPNRPFGQPFGIIGWMDNDKSIIINASHNIWGIDPDHVQNPTNITKKYRFKKDIEFRYLNFRSNNERVPVHANDTLIFAAFEKKTKKNGFFKLILGKEGYLNRPSMEPRIFYWDDIEAGFTGGTFPFIPIKARNANKYLVGRMSPSEYPNLYVSDDLLNFKQLTDFQPQQRYNWFTTELCHWKLATGKIAEGILYKPENFDPNKKYPLVIYYYETYSNNLNTFIFPAPSNGILNISWFLSNGYMVFIPDIYYKDGYPGQSALNTVVSAAKFLSKRNYIDGKHIGLQGHSFGGFETNYIVSHTNLFAAAASSSGESEIIIDYGLSNDYFESGQGRIGYTLWQRPGLYIKNSPIFRAQMVNTPMLIMHNDKDPIVSIQQGRAWFTALALLGKKAWFISYSDGHTIENEANRLDYSKRLEQFFDHFLKNKPSPSWMISGSNVLE